MKFAKEISKPFYLYVFSSLVIILILRIALVGNYYNNYGGIEPNIIYGIQRVILGQPLYQDVTSGTYAIMQFTPLYYNTIGHMARWLGINGLDVQRIYELCRVMAIIFNLLTILVVTLMIRAWRYGWAKSLVFGVCAMIILTSHYYARGDSMYLFLFESAIFSYICYSRKNNVLYIILAALLSAACIMVKQSGMLSAGIIGFCILFVERKFLVAALYSVCAVGFAYIIARLFNDGNWPLFYQNAYLGLKNGIDLSFLYNMFISQFFMDFVPCYVLGGIIAWLAVKQITDKTFRILATGAVLAFVFAIVTGLKVGSSNNYFTEFLIFVIAALPFLLQDPAAEKTFFRVAKYKITIRCFAYIAFFILITSKTVGLFSRVCIEGGFKSQKQYYVADEALYQYFTKDLKIKQGEYIFFTERHFLDNLFINYAMMPNKDVVSQIYTGNPATYNYSAFIAGMNNGIVKYIVTNEKRDDINIWNKDIPFIVFDKAKFKLMANKFGYNVYVYTGGINNFQ